MRRKANAFYPRGWNSKITKFHLKEIRNEMSLFSNFPNVSHGNKFIKKNLSRLWLPTIRRLIKASANANQLFLHPLNTLIRCQNHKPTFIYIMRHYEEIIMKMSHGKKNRKIDDEVFTCQSSNALNRFIIKDFALKFILSSEILSSYFAKLFSSLISGIMVAKNLFENLDFSENFNLDTISENYPYYSVRRKLIESLVENKNCATREKWPLKINERDDSIFFTTRRYEYYYYLAAYLLTFGDMPNFEMTVYSAKYVNNLLLGMPISKEKTRMVQTIIRRCPNFSDLYGLTQSQQKILLGAHEILCDIVNILIDNKQNKGAFYEWVVDQIIIIIQNSGLIFNNLDTIKKHIMPNVRHWRKIKEIFIKNDKYMKSIENARLVWIRL